MKFLVVIKFGKSTAFFEYIVKSDGFTETPNLTIELTVNISRAPFVEQRVLPAGCPFPFAPDSGYMT